MIDDVLFLDLKLCKVGDQEDTQSSTDYPEGVNIYIDDEKRSQNMAQTSWYVLSDWNGLPTTTGSL